ncbi:hypothetical protein F2P79_002040 [Pimephales promelas]|nr:hypothetical protein F2P79_002040 [Pimephales promelas]
MMSRDCLIYHPQALSCRCQNGSCQGLGGMLEKRNGHISKETGIWESQEGIFASEEYRNGQQNTGGCVSVQKSKKERKKYQLLHPENSLKNVQSCLLYLHGVADCFACVSRSASEKRRLLFKGQHHCQTGRQCCLEASLDEADMLEESAFIKPESPP